MAQEVKFNVNEVLAKLARLQADVEYIKSHIKQEESKELEGDKELQAEMKAWEQASEEDIINWEKENIKDE